MTEHELVTYFIECLQESHSPFGPLQIAPEFYFNSGSSDVIGLSDVGNIYVFEAKLDKWRRALDQAYRGTSFCDYAYILIPERKVEYAARRLHEFEYRGVGICTLGDTQIRVVHPARKNNPVLPWLKSKAEKYVIENYHG